MTIEPWQFLIGLIVTAGVAAFGGVHLGYFLLGHVQRGYAAHWKAEAERYTASNIRLLKVDAENASLKEDARVTVRMQPGYTLLLDRLADRDEQLAGLRCSHGALVAKFSTEACQLADRIAEARVADLAAVLMTRSKQIAELENRCGERDDRTFDEDSDLDTDLTGE